MGKRDQEILEKRARYIQKQIQRANSTAKAVKRLKKRLFVSEATIYRDLAK